MFFDCGQKILQHWRRNFKEVVKSAFYLNNRTFRGKYVFWRKYLHLQIFRVLLKNSADFCQKGFAPIWKTAFYTGSGGLLAWPYNFPRENLSSLTNFEGNCLKFSIFFFDMVVKTVFFVSRGHLCTNNVLFLKIFKFFSCFQTLRKTFRIFGENNFVENNLFFEFIKNCFFYELFEFRYCFPTVGRKKYNIGAETSEKLSKVHSTWTIKLFEESLFSEENIYFYKFFEFWSKTLRTSVGKCAAWFEKLLSTPVQGIFSHNNIIFHEKINAH